MGILKRKAEKNGSIVVRVPESATKEYATLREIADANGFDLAGALTDTVLDWLKRVRKELGVTNLETEKLSVRKASTAIVNGSGERA